MLNPLEWTAENWISFGVSAAIIVTVLVGGRWLVSAVLGRVVRGITGRTSTELDDILAEALKRPFYWFAVVFATEFSIGRLDFLPERFVAGVSDLFFVLYLVVAFVAVWRVIVGFFTWYSTRLTTSERDQGIQKQLLPFFRRVVLTVLSVLVIITALSHFDVDVTGLVTTLGIGSLAVALALQAALDDTISGFIIMVDQPFRIGDRIDIQELDTWGDVVDIGLRSSRIRTLDNRMVIVPNSIIGKSLIVNHSFPDTRYRMHADVGVAYGTDIEEVKGILRGAVEDLPYRIKSMPIDVLFMNMGASSLDFRVRFWVQVQQDGDDVGPALDHANTAIYNALNKAGIEIPFPQRDINHKLDPSTENQLSKLLKL